MSTLPLISQGDGFQYNPLMASMGGSYPNFSWNNQGNEWRPVPYTGAINPANNPPPFQYMNAEGWFQPPIAGWWQIMAQARPYPLYGLNNHFHGLFLGEVDPANIIAVAGGERAIDTFIEKIVYLNGTTDFISSGLYTTFTGTSTHGFFSYQYCLRAFYIHP